MCTNSYVYQQYSRKTNGTTHATLTPPVGAGVAYTATPAPTGGAGVAVYATPASSDGANVAAGIQHRHTARFSSMSNVVAYKIFRIVIRVRSKMPTQCLAVKEPSRKQDIQML